MTNHENAYKNRGEFVVDYGKEIEEEIEVLKQEIAKVPQVQQHYSPRWLAVKLLESDTDILEKISAIPGGPQVLKAAEKSIEHLEEIHGDDVDTLIADRRYGWINGLMKNVVKKTRSDRISTSDKIDQIVTNRFLGIPIFLFMMWIVFKITVDASGPFLDWVDGVIGGPLTNWVIAILGWIGLGGSWFESLVVDGVIAGVGGVLVFVPVLMAMYLALAILEDSGYMARAAFVMDRLMRAMGLHGKSFLPMIVGFGCTVPAFYATRTLENEEDRILTGLLVPFMSCGARLPVYVLFAAIFFPDKAGQVVFWLYMLGIAVAILLGFVLKRTLFKSKDRSPFVMELPPYRMPTFRSIWTNMWERTSSFVNKAFTLIMVTSVVIWFLLAIPLGGTGAFNDVSMGSSLFAGVSNAIAPVFSPAGFGSWEASGSLITGFVAKEVVVGTMAQIYEVEEAEEEAEATTFFQDIGEIVTSFVGATMDTVKSLPLIIGVDLFEGEEEAEPTALMTALEADFEKTSQGHGALASVAFMVFVLLYTPCMVAIAAERQELGAKWMWVSIIGQLILAWLFAVIIFQGGVLLGLG